MQMHTRHESIPDAFRRESCFTLDYARDRMLHALDQLGDADAWWRPHETMNAAGNLVLHVCGNLRQWIVCGVGGMPDTRDRQGEFAQRAIIPVSELRSRLINTVEEAKSAITHASDEDLLRTRFIQITNCTGLGAVYHSVAHLEGHAQEMIYIARLRLGERYRFKDNY